MIIRPRLAVVTALVVFAVAAPTEAFAATQKQIQAKLKKLKKLPRAASAAGVVNQRVTKVTKLNPKQAAKYYRVGLTKLGPANARQAADKLAKDVIKIVQRAGLSPSQGKFIIQTIVRVEQSYDVPDSDPFNPSIISPPVPYDA